MVRWYHLIISAYGFWLPNDPRGSWSEFVGSWELRKFGPATRTDEKRSLAHDPHDQHARRAAKKGLKYPAVRFGDIQRKAISEGFELAAQESAYEILACCIGYDHAHLIIARPTRTIEQIKRHLKSRATMALIEHQCHPLARFRTLQNTIPTPWSEGNWNVFIDDASQLRFAIAYVQRHPKRKD